MLGEGGAVSAAVARFEENMCAMAGRVAASSKVNMETFVSVNAPQSALARFEELGAQEREG